VRSVEENSLERSMSEWVYVYLTHYEKIRWHGVYDEHHKWWPIPQEVASCCLSVVSPTFPYKYTLLKHCQTMSHFANLHQLDYKVLRQAVMASPEYRKVKKRHEAKRVFNKVMGQPGPDPDYFGKKRKTRAADREKELYGEEVKIVSFEG